jgi:hypothetical protein
VLVRYELLTRRLFVVRESRQKDDWVDDVAVEVIAMSTAKVSPRPPNCNERIFNQIGTFSVSPLVIDVPSPGL